MTDYKIQPLEWLDTKYSSINHNHELYEEKELEQIIRVPYHSDENSYYDETSQEYIYYTVNSYIHENASSFEFFIENFGDMTGKDKFIVLEVDNGINIIIKEMNNNEVWLYTVDRDGSIYDTLTLGDECNYWEVSNKEVTISEPQTGISKDATIKVNVNYNRAIFYIYENNVLSDTITIHFNDEDYDYSFRNGIISLNYTGFTIKNNIKYYEPKIISTRNYTSDTIYYSDLREFGKAIFNVSFNANEQNFVIDNLCDIYYNDGYIYDNDTRDSENNPMPIKQGNEITIETIIDGLNGGIIVNLTEGFIHRKGYYENTYYYGNYESLNVNCIFDEVGIRAKRWEMDNLNNNINYKEDKSNKITQWSNNPSDTKYPSEKLVKDSLDGKQEKLVSGTNLRTLDGIDLLGEGDIAIDVNHNSSSVLFEDACDSASRLSDYGSSVAVRGSSSTMTIEYDSTENAYKCSGSNNYYAMIPIPILNDKDGYVLSVDVKGQSIGTNGIGLCINNRNDTTSYSYAVWMESMNKVVGKQFSLNSDGTVNQYGLSLSTNKYYRIELTVNGDSLTGKLYDGNTVLATDKITLTVENRQVGIFLLTQNGTTNSTCYVKNIKAENLGDSPIIFKDDCKADNTSDYVNNVHIGSQNTNINFAFDSSTNGYLFTGTGGDYFGGKVIPFNFEDKISISCDVKLLSTSAYNQCTIGITDSLNPSMSGNYDFFRIRGDNRCDYVHNNRDTSIKTGLSLVNNWVTLEISIDGTSLTGKLFDGNKTLLAQTSQITNTYSNPYIFIGLNCNGDNQKYVKNIIVKTNNKKLYLGDSIMTMINTALEHIITNWEDYD